MAYFFGFYGLKIGGGGSSYPNFVQQYQKPCNLAYFGVFLPALGWSCRTVLHTRIPAYRGFSTEIPIFFGFSGPKRGMGGSRAFSQTIKNPGIRRILEYFCLLYGGAAEQCCTPVYLYSR